MQVDNHDDKSGAASISVADVQPTITTATAPVVAPDGVGTPMGSLVSRAGGSTGQEAAGAAAPAAPAKRGRPFGHRCGHADCRWLAMSADERRHYTCPAAAAEKMEVTVTTAPAPVVAPDGVGAPTGRFVSRAGSSTGQEAAGAAAPAAPAKRGRPFGHRCGHADCRWLAMSADERRYYTCPAAAAEKTEIDRGSRSELSASPQGSLQPIFRTRSLSLPPVPAGRTSRGRASLGPARQATPQTLSAMRASAVHKRRSARAPAGAPPLKPLAARSLMEPGDQEDAHRRVAGGECFRGGADGTRYEVTALANGQASCVLVSTGLPHPTDPLKRVWGASALKARAAARAGETAERRTAAQPAAVATFVSGYAGTSATSRTAESRAAAADAADAAPEATFSQAEVT
jgi:hypothetical protein